MNKRLLNTLETRALMEKYEISLVPSRFVENAADVLPAAAKLGYPLVLKAVVPHMSHKSDAGLVVVNLKTELALEETCRRLETTLDGVEVEGYLLQKMVGLGLEVLLGVTRDAQFGSVIVFGAGGVMVELLKDTSLRLPPLNRWMAETMIAETKISRLLAGYRGSPALDKAALVTCLVNLSRLVMEEDNLISMDINPLFVLPEGVLAADVRIYWLEE